MSRQRFKRDQMFSVRTKTYAIRNITDKAQNDTDKPNTHLVGSGGSDIACLLREPKVAGLTTAGVDRFSGCKKIVGTPVIDYVECKITLEYPFGSGTLAELNRGKYPTSDESLN
ncbi:hypothetical protein TNCV_3114731 [Trichonephila clavipes]|nr:hypothetical protein TNCV_3114731 [Trichonephila clavipes]